MLRRFKPFFNFEKAGTEAKSIPAESRLGSDNYGLHRLPLLDYLAVAGLPVTEIREYGNTRLNVENHRRFVAKVNGDAVVARGNGHFDVFNDLALDFENARNSHCVCFWFSLVFSHDAPSVCVSWLGLRPCSSTNAARC